MEYCLVNIVLGDTDAPKPPEPPKLEPVFDIRVIYNFTFCIISRQ